MEMHWVESVTKAIQYMESNITEAIGVDDVADKVYASGSYFQRVFHIVTGITIGDYIRNRRLTLAAQDILAGQSLIDIAMKYQYDTQESFSKAFTRFHGVTPSGLRKSRVGAKVFLPLTINITITGGFDMSRKVIPIIRPLIHDNYGENYWFNGCAAYAMEALNEPDYDYWFFAGLTGDIFTQFYPLKSCAVSGIHGDCAVSDTLMGPDYAKWVFDQAGYACEYVTELELLAKREHYMQKIKVSIDRGVPVITLCWGVFVGYEDDGKTLLYITHEMEEPGRLTAGSERFLEESEFHYTEERIMPFHRFDLIFVGEKQREAPLAKLYREAIERLPALLTTQTENYIFGAKAFRAWADDIENGKYDDLATLEGDAKWDNYTNYVCVLATNSSCCFGFLEKAMELNPDMAWLKELYKLYRLQGALWTRHDGNAEETRFRKEYEKRHGKITTLEKLGGGFNISHKTLSNPKKRAKIVAKIREFADVTDEVLRVLNENL